MGILNVTPDSFSDGGRFFSAEKAIEHARRLAAEGADIIDIGGESTRPGGEPISAQEELGRVKPVIEAIVDEVDVPVSIDSYKPEVVETCLALGCTIVNDVTGLRNPEMIKLVAKRRVPVVAMHMLGMPKTMQENPRYRDVVKDIKSYFAERLKAAKKGGVKNVIIDPGIGFGKTVEHNLQLLQRLKEFKTLGCPIVAGPSRKSFIGKISGLDVNDRLEGTIAACVVAAMNGANILRVHDVKECKRALQIADAIVMVGK